VARLGIGAGALAAALLVAVFVPRPALTPTVANAGYMASTLQQDNGSTGWTATMDLRKTPVCRGAGDAEWHSRRDVHRSSG